MNHPVLSVLRRVTTGQSTPGARSLLEDLTPLQHSLEARLTHRYWQHHGIRPFVAGEMPFVINNSGWAAQAAVEVLHATLSALEPAPDRLVVLEACAGLGLFARQVLDGLRDRSQETGSGVYERLVYHVTDAAPATVAAWRESGQFAEHGAHVVPSCWDATQPSKAPGGPLHAVLCNYGLDALPSAVARYQGAHVEQLGVRTWLPWPESELRQRFGRSLTELRAADEDALLDLVPYLELEPVFTAEGAEEVPWAAEVLDRVPPGVAAPINYGALDFVTGVAERLATGGILLLADYGVTRLSALAHATWTHRFGHLATWAVNFPALQAALVARGFEVHTPAGDDQRSIHARLVCRPDTPAEAFSTFLAQAGDPRYVRADRVHLEAAEHVAAGRFDDALALYREAIEYCPTDWYMLGQASQFLCQQLLRYAEAHELAEAAVALNPWHSSFLYNTLGNALFCLGRTADARAAFERAVAIDPTDPQAHLNHAFALHHDGEPDAALLAVARGLASDTYGRFQAALLNKQAAILAGAAQDHALIRARVTARESALRRAHAAVPD